MDKPIYYDLLARWGKKISQIVLTKMQEAVLDADFEIIAKGLADRRTGWYFDAIKERYEMRLYHTIKDYQILVIITQEFIKKHR